MPLDSVTSCLYDFLLSSTGYAPLLIDFSYVLAAREGKIGGPEEPLSKSGEAVYQKYWTWMILKTLLQPFISDLHDTRKLEKDLREMQRFIETGLLELEPFKLCRRYSLPRVEAGDPHETVVHWISRKTAIRQKDVKSVMEKKGLLLNFEIDEEGRVRSMSDNDWRALLKVAFEMAEVRKMRLVDRARVLFDE